ncbi:MAG: DUF58 domain-containing protein [Thermotogae bacterium]|nr:DUF58 domain-containing protein [Thermotogota bacterium]
MRLPPDVVSEFELKVRKVVDGVLVGKFKSRSFGGSPEFAEYRPYNPGDDVRRIDWKVYARSRRLFLKIFFHESEIPLLIIYDDTGSMAYQGKHLTASKFAGALAYMAYRGNNAVSFFSLRGRYLPFGRGYDQVLRIYAQTLNEPSGSTDFKRSIVEALHFTRKRLLVAIVSDLAFPLDVLNSGINLLTRHHDVVAIHILAPGEWNFRDDGKILVDMERGRRLSVPPNSARWQRERVRGWVASVRRAVIQAGGRYSLAFSDEDFPSALRRVALELF